MSQRDNRVYGRPVKPAEAGGLKWPSEVHFSCSTEPQSPILSGGSTRRGENFSLHSGGSTVVSDFFCVECSSGERVRAVAFR